MATTPSPAAPPIDGAAQASPSEWLEFISSLVGSLAWPVAVLAILIIFRKELVRLVATVRERIPSMTSVKGFGVEAVWSASEVRKVAAEVSGLPDGASADDQPSGSEKSVELARIEPSAGVINAFLDVEREVGRYLHRAGIPWRGSPIPALQRSDLPRTVKDSVRDLSKLRNAAAHGLGDITLDSALEYITTARHLARAIALGEYDFG
ncbi:hypothetical protein [Microbacterium aurum]